jgi:enamine deaminase RidA (YjgF/YER057c/UK114 family)
MIEERLQALGIKLPAAPRPVASYVPAVEAGPLLFISGQLPFHDGALLHVGQVPDPVSVEAAREAARQCVINALAVAREQLGSLDRVERVARLSGYVACSPTFYQQPVVINGASDLLEAVFGTAGKHSRIAVGVASLPLNAPVELDLILLVKGATW